MDPLIVPGALESLEAIREYIATAASMAGLDKRASYRLTLAVDEIAANSVQHGYAKAGIEGVLIIRADLGEQTLTISLEDTGAAYNPEHQSTVDRDIPIEQRQAGGLGLLLAIGNVDSLHYERIGNRNRHIFLVKRSTAAS
jgi:serine/threonine-protein kinase RsbW